MCSDMKKLLFASLVLLSACSPYRQVRKISSGELGVGLSVVEDVTDRSDETEITVDSIRSTLSDGPLIMKAVKDTETGEMVATDVISASKVTARFRNVPERAGLVTISFDVSVPAAMALSKWQLKIFPEMTIQKDTVAMEPVYITGSQYREKQLRGYERYNAFVESILSDPEEFLRIGQLEIFLQRHFPEIYSMKRDSSIISDSRAENIFGVTVSDAYDHYRRNLKWRLNERKKQQVGKMYRKYVKDPVLKDGIRLDTVISSPDGDIVYRYVQEFKSRPDLKKVNVSLTGSLYEDGEAFLDLPFDDDLTFYISSLSGLADEKIRYRMLIQERRVYDNTKAFIDFEQASAAVDTALGNNASELKRIRNCIDDVVARKEFVLDSLVIKASCSPEGSYSLNRKLSAERSEAIRTYMEEYVPESWRDSLRTSSEPENWDQFIRLVECDTVLRPEVRKKIVIIAMKMEDEPDALERQLSEMEEYGYLREELYPKLRTVSFDFHLHRAGVVQDTVYTKEIDTTYMDGLRAIRELDYKKAVTLLRQYDDYNSALAFMCADYNHSALDVLGRQNDKDPRVCYLKAMVLSRLEQYEEALKYFELAVLYDPRLEFRANLDPEMYEITKYRQNKQL